MGKRFTNTYTHAHTHTHIQTHANQATCKYTLFKVGHVILEDKNTHTNTAYLGELTTSTLWLWGPSGGHRLIQTEWEVGEEMAMDI